MVTPESWASENEYLRAREPGRRSESQSDAHVPGRAVAPEVNSPSADAEQVGGGTEARSRKPNPPGMSTGRGSVDTRYVPASSAAE